MAGNFDDVVDRVLYIHEELQDWGKELRTLSEAKFDTLATEASALVASLDDLAFEPDFTGLDLTPGTFPAPPDMPAEETDAPVIPTLSELGEVSPYEFTPVAYSALMKAAVMSVLNQVLAGNGLVAQAIWDGFYSRAVGLAGEQDLAERRKVEREYSRFKGHAVGKDRRLREISHATAQTLSKTVLEQALQRGMQTAKEVLDGLTQSNELERLWIGQWNAEQDRLAKLAEAKVTFAININNALLEQDRAKLAIYTTTWQGISARVNAQVAKLNGLVAAKQIEMEGVKLQADYQRLILDKGIRVAEGVAKTAIEIVDVKVKALLGALTAVANGIAGIAQAAMSAMDANLGTSAGMSSGESIDHNYNHTCGGC